MYIFSRATMLDRHQQMAAAGAAVEVAGMVSSITGLSVNVYLTRYGQPMNSLRWSCRLESQAEMQAATEKLLADGSYVEWVGKHSHMFEVAPTDMLANVISSSGMEAGPSAFYTVLTATAANGRLADAVAFGVKAQQFVAEAPKLSTAFTTNVYGAFGTVTWLTGANSMEGIDSIDEMQMSNSGYHELVKEAGDMFVTGSGMTALIQKIN